MMGSRVALIPARGGSQRIPRKNIKPFVGVPALARVISGVLSSGTVDRVVVSTDDAEIASVARSSGAETPFTRPASLADSHTGARPVIQHAIKELGLDGSALVGVIYPTAVLMTPDDLHRSCALMTEEDCDFVLSVAAFAAPIERALTLDQTGRVAPVNPSHILTRTQDLAVAFHDIGQCYWGRATGWLGSEPVVTSRSRAYVVESWRAVDIDTPEDWVRAEMIYRLLHG